MKAKKILFLTVLSLLLLVGLVGTGTALAGPAVPTVHHVHVTGTIVDVTFTDTGPGPVLDPSGRTWHEAGVFAGTYLGNLKGTLAEPATFHGPGGTPGAWNGDFWWQGKGTFKGKLNGMPIRFTYKSLGRGYDGFGAGTPAHGTYYQNRAVYFITGSTGCFAHLRGIIYEHTYVDANGEGGTTYWGDLYW
jgi:hypothetical protein